MLTLIRLAAGCILGMLVGYQIGREVEYRYWMADTQFWRDEAQNEGVPAAEEDSWTPPTIREYRPGLTYPNYMDPPDLRRSGLL